MAIRSVLVCGAGLMGHGIAQVLAAAGLQVTIFEPERSRAEAGLERIAGNLARAVARDQVDGEARSAQLGRLRIADSLADGAARADLVIEAVTEDETVKRALFAGLDPLTPEAAMFASNTSSISITRLASAVSPARRSRFVGLHFFSPVPVMNLSS